MRFHSGITVIRGGLTPRERRCLEDDVQDAEINFFENTNVIIGPAYTSFLISAEKETVNCPVPRYR